MTAPQTQSSDDELHEAKRIHAPLIEMMKELGFGLFKDGKTFYQLGCEIEPDLGMKFDINQAYVIVNAAKSYGAQCRREGEIAGRISERELVKTTKVVTSHLKRQLVSECDKRIAELKAAQEKMKGGSPQSN